MAEFVIEELPGRRASEDEQGQRTYTRIWRVTAPSAKYGARQVVAELGISRGMPYKVGESSDDWAEEDEFVYINRIEAQQSTVEGDEDGCDWTITATYGFFDPDKGENPLDDPPEVNWSFASYQSIADRAYDEQGDLTIPVLNTAGDPFDPPIELDDPRPILTVTVNLPYPEGFDPAMAYEYRNAVNADPFFGVPPGFVKSQAPVARRLYHPACGFYWQVTYEFQFNPLTWTKVILNLGTRQLTESGDDYESILTKDGQLCTDPVPLDEDGRALEPDDEPIYLAFDVFPRRPFASYFGFGDD